MRIDIVVSFQFSQNSTPSAIVAVTSPPTSCTSPVPTKFRTPSASVMMREMRIPVLVESKYAMGKRNTKACMDFRMSVMARWAATPRICDSPNEAIAWTIAATPTAAAITPSRSARFCPTTWSMR